VKLKLADDLALPADEAVTQKYGFIGRSGSGKSYAAMRLAELFLDHGAQIIALDWVGIWWSLRLAADGKTPGSSTSTSSAASTPTWTCDRRAAR
jgi:hypothetical protein